jgi:hypothetical protein
MAQSSVEEGESSPKKWKHDPSEGFPIRPFTADMATRLPSGRSSASNYEDLRNQIHRRAH